MTDAINTYNKIEREEDDVYTKDGTLDYKNNPANKNTTGTWKACPYILGTILPYPSKLVLAMPTQI